MICYRGWLGFIWSISATCTRQNLSCNLLCEDVISRIECLIHFKTIRLNWQTVQSWDMLLTLLWGKWRLFRVLREGLSRISTSDLTMTVCVYDMHSVLYLSVAAQMYCHWYQRISGCSEGLLWGKIKKRWSRNPTAAFMRVQCLRWGAESHLRLCIDRCSWLSSHSREQPLLCRSASARSPCSSQGGPQVAGGQRWSHSEDRRLILNSDRASSHPGETLLVQLSPLK